MIKRETLELEIVGSKAALNSHEQGIEIHKIVLKAFEEELKKLPTKITAKVEEKNIKSVKTSQTKVA